MAEEQAVETIQAQLDENRDWLKFVLAEYFKWYAAFLALNIAAFVFANQSGSVKLIAATFAAIDLVGAALACSVYYWTLGARKIAAFRLNSLLEMVGLRPEKWHSYPGLPADFGLIASAVTQLIFALVWLYVLVSGRLF
jgi:hypothetical protein